MQLGKFWGKTFWILTAILLVFCARTPAQTPPRTVLPGHVPAVVSRLSPLGRLDGSILLKLSLSLPLHQEDALTNLLDQLYDAGSPQYHHYLTPEEFDGRFGPTTNDYQTLIAWAEHNGLTVTGRHPNRMLLEIRAPVTNIEHALQVTLRTYVHPTEARTFFAPDTEPSVSAGLPLLSIGGLDNYSRPHPKNLRRTPLTAVTKGRLRMGSGPSGNLAGFDYRAAYAPGVNLTGTGQQVGLLEFDGYYPADIATYESQMGLPSVALQNILLDGFDGTPTGGTNSANGEVALDIEMAVSMAPGLDQVVVFEDNPAEALPYDVLQAVSTNKLIKQFSCSWDFGSVNTGTMDNYFEKLAAQGQSFFNASGDGGANNDPVPPDDDPYVTLVGGTTLATTGPAGTWLAETAWNSGEGPGHYDTSGGVSAIYGIPVWQRGVNMSANQGSTSMRNCPDVAMVAANIYLVADNGQSETTGGTSAAAPLWAGFAALVNQQAAAAGQSSVGFLNPALYHIGTNSAYTACFNDITAGNNTNRNATQYFAVPGYDLCTGWGSPNGGSLILALTQPDGFQITPGRGATANGQSGGPFTVSSQTFGLTNTGKATLNWSLVCDSAWVNIPTNGGTLAAGAGTTLTVTLNSAAGELPAGAYAAGLWFTNQTSGQGQLRQFSLQVDQELVRDGGFESADFCYWNLSGNASVYTNDLVVYGPESGYYSYEGDFFAVLAQINFLANLSQSLPTQPGQFYLLSFELANPSGGIPNQFEVQWNASPASANIIYNQTDLGTFDWTNLQFIVMATTNQTTLQFSARNDLYFFALDSVSVTPLPTQTLGVSSVILNNIVNTAGLAPTSDLRSRATAQASATHSAARKASAIASPN
jgi:hypothetical protein